MLLAGCYWLDVTGWMLLAECYYCSWMLLSIAGWLDVTTVAGCYWLDVTTVAGCYYCSWMLLAIAGCY